MDNERPSQHRGLAPAWKPGQSGNPKGRPKGARSKLGETFLHELYEDFRQHGPDVIVRVRNEDPGAYLKAIATLSKSQRNALLGAPREPEQALQ